MSLPSQFSFPSFPSTDDAKTTYEYLKDLHQELNEMYSQMATNINGTIRSSVEVDSSKWTPTLIGSTASGAFTYTTQVGWSLRQGILTEIWFDIAWSATTATGNLQIQLPYICAITNGEPFNGPLFFSGVAFGTGTAVVVSPQSDTYTANFNYYSNGGATGIVQVSASGMVAGSVRYIGTEDE